MSFWNDERDAAITRMWSEDLTASQIAQRIGGTTRNAVIGRVRRLNLPYRNPHRVGLAPWRTGQDDRIHKARVAIRYSVPKPKKKKLPPVRELLQSLPTEPLPPRDPMPAQVSFNDLEAHHCRAPVGTEFHPDKPYYCGEEKIPGSSYCECHTRRYMTAITVVKAKQPERPSWSENNVGRKNTVFMSGREKMKAY